MITKAVLLAAGRGSRLGALTEELPKPLLTVAGRPIIVHILDGLRRAGIEEITVVTGYLGDVLERELGNGEASGLLLRYVRQTELDGTARALALARDGSGTRVSSSAGGTSWSAPRTTVVSCARRGSLTPRLQ